MTIGKVAMGFSIQEYCAYHNHIYSMISRLKISKTVRNQTKITDKRTEKQTDKLTAPLPKYSRDGTKRSG